MAWIPKYVVSGGMYGGQNCPAGSLTGLISICPNSYTNAQCAFGTGGRYNSELDYVTWAGAYGMSDALIKEYMLSHDDRQQHTFDLVEIDVKNPQGAQYYKQSIVFKATILAETQEIPGSEPGSNLKMLYYEISLTAYRREYPTPYSAYTDTSISDRVGLNGYYYISGNEEIGGWLYFLTTRLRIALGDFTYQNNDYFGIALYKQEKRCDNEIEGWQTSLIGISYEYLNGQFGLFDPDETDDPNEEPDPPGPGEDEDGGGGGEGDHTLPDMPIPIPDLPDIGAASVSWLTVYKMSGPQLSEFGQAMLEATLWDAIKQFFNNPLEAIVNIILCPVDAPSSRSKTPEVGRGPLAQQWPNAYPVVDNEFVSINCGNIQFNPYWDSAFDFDPYTKIQIFLHFIGYKPLKVDEVMGCGVNVTYHIDVCTGDCIAFISRIPFDDDAYGPYQPQLIAQFEGNCGVRVPISRLSADAAIDASLRLMTQGMGLLGDIAGSTAGGKNGISDPSNLSMSQVGDQLASATMTAVNGMKQHIERSGALGGNSGYMGKLRPYIIREIPRQLLPRPNKDFYWKLEGYPSNIGANLAFVAGSGLQMVEAIELDGLPAYDSEITEIETILKGGIIV